MEDLQIVQLYWDRDQQAIACSKEKYGIYCFTVANHILDNFQDSEECVSDTWLSAWNAMPPHRPQVLRMFFAKITRRLAFNRFKANSAQKRGGALCDPCKSTCVPRHVPAENTAFPPHKDHRRRSGRPFRVL